MILFFSNMPNCSGMTEMHTKVGYSFRIDLLHT